jgi:hypothetical protein
VSGYTLDHVERAMYLEGHLERHEVLDPTGREITQMNNLYDPREKGCTASKGKVFEKELRIALVAWTSVAIKA